MSAPTTPSALLGPALSLGPQAIRLALCDDDVLVTRSLIAHLSGDPSIEVVGSAVSTDEAIALIARTQPDVAIVDVRMPGGGGVCVTAQVRRSAPCTKVIVLSGAHDRETVLQALEAGAIAYLVKGDAPDQILDAVRAAAAGRTLLPAVIAGELINEVVQTRGELRRGAERLRSKRTRLERVLADEQALEMVLQPICRLDTKALVGAEALARFHATPRRGPQDWFREATEVGLSHELEIAAITRALKRLETMPGTAYLSLNASPATAISPQLRRILEAADAHRIVLEITEHAPIGNYERFRERIGRLRSLGVRLAVDDVGAGYASLRHILELQPEIIKLDVSLIAGIATDKGQQALTAGLVSFAGHIGAVIVAEGIETVEELDALAALGVTIGQGFYLGAPAATLGA